MNEMNNKTTQSWNPFENNYEKTLSEINVESKKGIENENAIITSLFSLTNKINDLENENRKLQKDLEETRFRENKLLNRFSWLILIINISSVLLAIILLILFINCIYPFISRLINDDIGIRVIISTLGGAILLAILGVWWELTKYIKWIKERETR